MASYKEAERIRTNLTRASYYSIGKIFYILPENHTVVIQLHYSSSLEDKDDNRWQNTAIIVIQIQQKYGIFAEKETSQVEYIIIKFYEHSAIRSTWNILDNIEKFLTH